MRVLVQPTGAVRERRTDALARTERDRIRAGDEAAGAGARAPPRAGRSYAIDGHLRLRAADARTGVALGFGAPPGSTISIVLRAEPGAAASVLLASADAPPALLPLVVGDNVLSISGTVTTAAQRRPARAALGAGRARSGTAGAAGRILAARDGAAVSVAPRAPARGGVRSRTAGTARAGADARPGCRSSVLRCSTRSRRRGCCGRGSSRATSCRTSPGAIGTMVDADLFLNVWILAWIAHAALTDPAHLYDGNIFHPGANTIAGSENMLAHLPFTAPALALTGNALVMLKAYVLECFVLSGVAMFLFVRHHTRSDAAALLGGAAFTFTFFRASTIPQPQYLGIQFLPLALLCVDLWLERRRARWLAGLALAIGLQALSCVYIGFFTLVVVPVYAAVRLLDVRERRGAAAAGSRRRFGVRRRSRAFPPPCPTCARAPRA